MIEILQDELSRSRISYKQLQTKFDQFKLDTEKRIVQIHVDAKKDASEREHLYNLKLKKLKQELQEAEVELFKEKLKTRQIQEETQSQLEANSLKLTQELTAITKEFLHLKRVVSEKVIQKAKTLRHFNLAMNSSNFDTTTATTTTTTGIPLHLGSGTGTVPIPVTVLSDLHSDGFKRTSPSYSFDNTRLFHYRNEEEGRNKETDGSRY
ncbi:hypothetical protein HDU76_011627 [Blyttiomyces sp. JEL0837]|nr:hypothetical protein HDU76_011627 [Blyttiomyces sp. JEL0837]